MPQSRLDLIKRCLAFTQLLLASTELRLACTKLLLKGVGKIADPFELGPEAVRSFSVDKLSRAKTPGTIPEPRALRQCSFHLNASDGPPWTQV